ncbi:MAG: hypothetical protein Q7R93_01255 [bacterium]|nr:hypothetical protein [bacterium]
MEMDKYTKNKTLDELLKTQANSVVGGEVHQAVTLEIQRIQQDTNNTQISKLIAEVSALKSITEQGTNTSDQNARSSNKLAKTAVWISIVLGVLTILFNVHIKTTWVSGAGRAREMDLGIFGTYKWNQSW